MESLIVKSTKVALQVWKWAPLFATGFLLSRIFARGGRDGLAGYLLRMLLKKSGSQLPIVLLVIMSSSIFLSLFIPNVLTVLTLLAVIEKLREAVEAHPEAESKELVTPIGLSLIYGANIGGMGSMVGSPANALLLFWLSFYSVPGLEHINFLSWLAWGIPLVIVFGLLAWGLLVLFFIPRRFYKLELNLDDESGDHEPSRLRIVGAKLALLTGVFWISTSLLSSLLPSLKVMWEGFSMLFCLGFIYYVFFVQIEESNGEKRPLLRLEDCYTGLPWKGVFLAGVAGGMGAFLFWLGAPKWLASHMQAFLPTQLTPFAFYLTFAMVTIFATELMSNTAVSVAMFPVAYQLSISMGMNPLPVMIAVALASTCAFMSPIATPATGLAFGGMEGVSLKRMLVLGFFVNLLGGLWLTWFLTSILPWIYPVSS
tara:strand:- start:18702 stop:19982 length:1281 start_codon:yes stop_codon:yes gene_type:complete